MYARVFDGFGRWVFEVSLISEPSGNFCTVACCPSRGDFTAVTACPL